MDSDPSLRFGISEKLSSFSTRQGDSSPGTHSKKVDTIRSLLEMGLPLRWFITTLLFALAAGVMAFNKMTVCSWMRRKNPAATISIVGGCLGAAGCLISPLPWLNKAWWLPTVFDIVGVPYLIIIAWFGLEKWLKQLGHES